MGPHQCTESSKTVNATDFQVFFIFLLKENKRMTENRKSLLLEFKYFPLKLYSSVAPTLHLSTIAHATTCLQVIEPHQQERQ